jgi:hypothetical protein
MLIRQSDICTRTIEFVVVFVRVRAFKPNKTLRSFIKQYLKTQSVVLYVIKKLCHLHKL